MFVYFRATPHPCCPTPALVACRSRPLPSVVCSIVCCLPTSHRLLPPPHTTTLPPTLSLHPPPPPALSRCSLLVARRSSLVARCSLLVARLSSLVARCSSLFALRAIHRLLVLPPTAYPCPPKQRRVSSPLSSLLRPRRPRRPCDSMWFHLRRAAGPSLLCPLLLPCQQNRRPLPLKVVANRLAANPSGGYSDHWMLRRLTAAQWSGQARLLLLLTTHQQDHPSLSVVVSHLATNMADRDGGGGRRHTTALCLVAECGFLYSSFVRLCVRFRMAFGNQLAMRVFREGFPYFKYYRTESKSSLS